MIKTLFKVAVIVVVALLGYNYFLGDAEEKAQSREIVGKVGDLGKDAWDLLKSEREKMREGKYDAALEKLDGLYVSLRGKAESIRDNALLRELHELEQRRAELEDQAANGEPDAETKRKIEDLTADTEVLMKRVDPSGPAPE